MQISSEKQVLLAQTLRRYINLRTDDEFIIASFKRRLQEQLG